MLELFKHRIRITTVFGLIVLASLPASFAYASPYGQGVYSADVPYGSVTSMTISLGSSPALNMTLIGGNFEGTGSHTLTLTTTDVVGYRLYIYATNTNMANGGDTVAASANVSLGALSVNSWGYNTTGSTTNFIGVTHDPVVLKDANGPYKNGDDTTVTYGAKVSKIKGAGAYTTAVVYTAVAKSQ